MNYSTLDECLQALLEAYIPLSRSQQGRLSQFCACVLLAGSSQVPRLARWLRRDAKQNHREQWLHRLLKAPFVSQERVYQPWLRQAMQQYHAPSWHLVVDRTNLVPQKVDLVMVGLAYHKRALPLTWQHIPYGGAPIQTYMEVLQACKPLLPPNIPVVLHGDVEFGAIPMLHFAREQGWDFILGQRCHYQCLPFAQHQWQPLAQFPLTRRQPLYLANVTLTKGYRYRPVNLFGFLHKGKNDAYEPRFYATSLPITRTLRHIGQHRWSIECCFRDFKSSGWHIDRSQLCHPQARECLLVLLSVCYLWATCLGRWLCKTGQRHLVDTHPHRQLSLFRIGWDWLVYQFRHQLPIPHLLTLYP